MKMHFDKFFHLDVAMLTNPPVVVMKLYTIAKNWFIFCQIFRHQTLTGKEIEIDIEPTDKVDRIKERVEEKEGIPPQQQRLIFSGKQMYVNHNNFVIYTMCFLRFDEIDWLIFFHFGLYIFLQERWQNRFRLQSTRRLGASFGVSTSWWCLNKTWWISISLSFFFFLLRIVFLWFIICCFIQ